MGGGDLNLKKSWHPSTMKNMEKVWKAEKRETEERKRIAELQREIIAERSREDMQRFAENSGAIEKKDNTKLDWMYKGPSGIVDREEYLLGRSVDKTFEQIEQTEQQGKALSSRKNAVERGDECLPNSIRFASDQQVDLARKMLEDPLLAIKKKEVESRQQLLSNPVKMKQLKQLVEMHSKSKKHKKEKKKKKDKKKRKKKSSKTKDSDSDNSDVEEDRKLNAILAKKLNSLKNAGLLKNFNEHIDDLEERKKTHKKLKEQRDGDFEQDERDVKDFSNKRRRSESNKNDDEERGHRDKIKRERSRSRESLDSRRKPARMESHENSRYSNRTKEEPGKNRRESSYDSRYTSSQKYGKNFDQEDEHRERKIKHEDRKDHNINKSRNQRSRSRSPDYRNKHTQNRIDRDKEQKHRLDDKISKSRLRRESSSSDRSPRGGKPREKWIPKTKEPSKKHESSGSSDSASSSDSSSESDSDHKQKTFTRRERSFDIEERRPQLPKFGLMLPDGSKPVPKSSGEVKVEKRSERVPEKQKWQKPERKKLDEREVEARRREMMENSSWREKERERNIRRHREEMEEESRQLTKYDENFGRKQLAHAVSQSTVEGRIKANINNIQRSKMAMDKNFARR